MDQNFKAFQKLILHPVRFRMFLFAKLPAGFFTGLQANAFDENACTISVPFKWFNQNPFRSTYFASLSMAAEMSTGALAMGYLYRSEIPMSLLVTSIKGDFFKKAINNTCFTCEDGVAFKEAIEAAKNTGQAQTLTASSIGKNKEGDIIARFDVTWSFKRKRS